MPELPIPPAARRPRLLHWLASVGVAVVALLVTTSDVRAYYDDVHYALTYYIARRCGFTPLQAYRIASADVSVDYDPGTEPVQPTPQKLQLVGIKSFAQTPRWKFHAFRNELEYPGTAGKGADAEGAARIPDAKAAILVQQSDLWDRAIKADRPGTRTELIAAGGNPGVFLHFFQDREPHAAYGSAWGHWPLDPEFFPKALEDRLPIGGTTDWVDFRPGDVSNVARDTATWLGRYMKVMSPLQTFVAPQDSDFDLVIRELAKPPNTAPTSIDTELKRELYARKFGLALPLIGGIPPQKDASSIADLASDLNGRPSADFDKHGTGPNMTHAASVINAALKLAGMDDVLPTAAFKFTYNLDGDLWVSSADMLNNWVLVGTVKVNVLEEKNGVRTPLTQGTVTLKLAKLRRDGEDQVLGAPQPISGGPVTFEKVPVGDLIVEVTGSDGVSRGRLHVTLQTYELDVEAIAPASSSAASATGSPFEGTQWGGGGFTYQIQGGQLTWLEQADYTTKRNCCFSAPASAIEDPITFAGALGGNHVHWELKVPPARYNTTSGRIKYHQSGFDQVCDLDFDGKSQLIGKCTNVGRFATDDWYALRPPDAPVTNSVQIGCPTGHCPSGPVAPSSAGPTSISLSKTSTPTPAIQPSARPTLPRDPDPTTTDAPGAPPSLPAGATAKPPAASSTECAAIRLQRTVLAENIQSVTKQIAETTLAVRAEALKRRLAELQQSDQEFARQELRSCR